MIKVISDLHPPSLLDLQPGDTTVTIEQRLQITTGQNFTIQLIETSNNRVLPRDEILMDEREYFVNYLTLPVKGGI